jgi:hypothetical protein
MLRSLSQVDPLACRQPVPLTWLCWTVWRGAVPNLTKGCWAFAVYLASATLPLVAWAQELPDSSVEVVMIDGSVRRVQLRSIGPEFGLEAVDGQKIPVDDIRELRTNQPQLGDDPTTLTVLLRGDGVLYARSITSRDGLLTIATDLAELKYALLDIQGIRLPTNEGEAEWQAMLREPSKEEDRLLVSTSRGPRVVSGLIEAIDPQGVQIVFEDAERRVTMDKILAMVPAVLDESAEPKFQIRLVDRSVMVADAIEYRDEKWAFRRRQETTEFPRELVASLRVRSDRVLYLSDLSPVIDEVQTVIAPPASNRRDTSVMGSPLVLVVPSEAGPASGVPRVFAKGWGVRSRSRLVFEIPAGYNQLRGWVGIDTATAGQGSCEAFVFVDGIQVGSWPLDGRQVAREVLIPFNGGRRLELLVEPGPQLDLSDWVNWADLRLIK